MAASEHVAVPTTPGGGMTGGGPQGQTPPRLVRWLHPLVGETRALQANTIATGLWPFFRILMFINLAVVLAAIGCYFVESRRSFSVEDSAVTDLPARRSYTDSEGATIVSKGDPVTEDALKKLKEAGYEKVAVLDNGMYQNVEDAVWWGFVTMTTVGYGDRFPKTTAGRVFGVLLMFSSIILIGSFTATVSSVFVAARLAEQQAERAIEWQGHIVFCGWNDTAPSILKAISARSARRQIVFINEKTEDSMELSMRGYANLEMRFIRGNFVREEELTRAALLQAASVLIIPDASEGRAPDDNKTIEATITIKDMAPHVKVYAHVLDVERVPNLRRAMVDDVVVRDEFSDELLSGFVTTPGFPQMVRELTELEGSNEIVVVEVPQQFRGQTALNLWDHLKRERNELLVGLVAEEEGFGLETAMRGGDPYIVEFIKEQIADAGIKTQVQGSRTRVTVNPANGYVIQDNELALVMRNRGTVAQRTTA